jgi:hypothetical protein
MTKRTCRVLKVLVISLAAVAISRGGVVLAATLPVATLQSSVEKELRTPTHLVVGADGSLYVSDPANRGVLKFNSAGKLLQKIVVKGIPHGVAVTADGRLLVSQKETVSIHDAAGTEIGRLGAGAGQFMAASDITLDDTGLIYVSDSKGGCVQVFSGGGAYLSRFGVKGSGAGEFRYPTAIAFEKVTKQIAVVDSLNGRVQFYDKSGAYVRSIGANGTGPLKFMHPQGLAFEYGAGSSVRMYVSDAMLKVIQAIDPAGSGIFLSYVGAVKGTHGSPSDLAFDQVSRRLFVIDGMGSITVYRITDGNVVVDNVTPALPGNATVITSSATSGTSVATPSVSTVSPLILSTVADGSTVTRELLNVTGLVSGVSSVTVNGLPVAVSNGLFSTAVPLVSGITEVVIAATDKSGRSWKEVRNVNRDVAAPTLTVDAPDLLATAAAVLNLKGSVDAGIYVAVAGMPAEISKQGWSTAVTLNPGLNTIEIQAIDLAGQVSSQKRTVFYNASAPDLAITAPAEDVVSTKKSIAVKGSVSEGSGVTVTAEVNGIPKKVTVDNGRFKLPLEFTEEGSYTVNVYAGVSGGNVSTVSRTIVYRKAP